MARRMEKAGLLCPRGGGGGLVSLQLVSAMPITLSQPSSFSSLLPPHPSGALQGELPSDRLFYPPAAPVKFAANAQVPPV